MPPRQALSTTAATKSGESDAWVIGRTMRLTTVAASTAPTATP